MLGMAYKRDVDDVRESPALDILRLLEAKGATVSFHDPLVAEVREDGGVRRSVPFTAETVANADAIVLVTDHSEVDYRILEQVNVPVVDTRNALRSVHARVIGLSGTRAPRPGERI